MLDPVKQIFIPATTVLGNEKAYSYQELHCQSPTQRGFHRYRIIVVNRDGRPAEFRQDMGNVKQWRGVRCFNIPSLFEHTVDELLDIADYLRNDPPNLDLAERLELNKDQFKITS